MITVAAGLSLPAAGLSITWSAFFSWRKTIYDLNGINGVYGFSGGVGFASAGADVLKDSRGILGIQLNFGFGFSFPINLEGHGYLAYSHLFVLDSKKLYNRDYMYNLVTQIKVIFETLKRNMR